MSSDRPIVLFETQAASRKRTIALLEQLGHTVVSASTTEEATAVLEELVPAALLIADDDAGREFGSYAREFAKISVPTAALVSHDNDEPDRAVKQMTADGYVRRPCSAAALEAFLSMGQSISALRAELNRANKKLSDARGKLRKEAATGMRFHRYDAVKDLLVVEVRRAKRYGYPLSVLMVGLDPLPADVALKRTQALEREVTAGLAVAIGKSIRLIDVPIQYQDNRILVFLPHTGLSGAEQVGRRIRSRIKRITYRAGGVTAELTASVGVAGMEPGDNFTFSKLIKVAASALRAAQLKGGDRVLGRTTQENKAVDP